MEQLRRKDLDIQELKRHRLEKEEEADRYKILLKAQEQRNAEQLVTVDKYHAAVANHDAEMRCMHVLLESERTEMHQQLENMQASYALSKHKTDQKIECWKFTCEDVLSRLNFNPATAKIETLEREHYDVLEELKEL